MAGYLGRVSAEVRIDAETGDWRIIAPNRAARPVDRPGSATVCPFCPGNEAMTPPEVLRTPATAPHHPAVAESLDAMRAEWSRVNLFAQRDVPTPEESVARGPITEREARDFLARLEQGANFPD